MKSFTKLLAVLTVLALCAGCGAAGQANDTAAADTAEAVIGAEEPAEAAQAEDSVEENTKAAEDAAESEYFTNRDYETEYSDYVTVTLSDGASAADGAGVTVDGDTVTFTEKGTYLITGALSNGQLVVDAADDVKVQLVLDNASVTCEGSAALYIVSADKVFLTTAEGSENALISAGEYAQDDENNVDGAIFSESTLTMNGLGALAVESEAGHGVVVKGTLKITSGAYDITAAKNGAEAKTVRIAGGDISIESGNDGIQADSNNEEKGYVYIAGGTFNIVCEHDAIQASTDILIEDGDFTVLAGGGYENAPEKTNFWDSPSREMFSGENEWEESETDTDESDSAKGLKADGDITVTGGTFALDTADDTIHSGNAVMITGGAFTLNSGDDGVHADVSLLIAGGVVDIENSYEGLEAQDILITDGEVSIIASDDGMNANGGMGMPFRGSGEASEESEDTDGPVLRITGGTVYVDAGGDGLDSNGDLYIDGGTVYISGPSTDWDSPIDYGDSNNEFIISGGTVMAAGYSGMAESPDSTDDAQPAIFYVTDDYAADGETVTLTDAAGNTILEYSFAHSFNCVILSSPELTVGETYTLTIGGEAYEIELTDTIFSNHSHGGPGGMGGFGGGRGGSGEPS